MAELIGFKEFSVKLSKMGKDAGGKTLRSAAMTAMLPALHAARAAAPVADPPYFDKLDKRFKDPYPKKTYKGRLRLPGYTSRHIRRASYLSRDKTRAYVHLGVTREAFAALSFVELGTSRYPARPWLEPSFKASQSQVIARLGEQLGKKIEKAAKL